MTHDVFISYSSSDQKMVEGLSAYLEQNGVRCFVAYRDIPKGIAWAEIITEAIENCKLMIVVFSEGFNRSKQVDREIEMCIEEGKPILTFKIENVDFKGAKKYYLKNINWVDAFPEPQKYFGEMLKSVQSLLPETKKEPEKEIFVEKKEIKKEQKYEKKTNKNMILILLAIFVSVCVVGLVFFFLLNKNDKNIEPTPTKIEIKTDTIILQGTTTEPKKEVRKDVVAPQPTTERETTIIPQQPTEQKSDTIKVKKERGVRKTINFNQNASISSTSGEVFEVEEGDYFIGEVQDGIIHSGKIFDSNGKIKHLVQIKRNE